MARFGAALLAQGAEMESYDLGAMAIKTRRWDEPTEGEDGLRVLVCRYRPRGVSKRGETWDVWYPQLGPSKELHRAFWPRTGSPISWPRYRTRYLAEQKQNAELIQELGRRHLAGETITLLCSSACERESRCHRSILRELIESVR
jgi:uncharacterized protein YeaO (DUF488 family)